MNHFETIKYKTSPQSSNTTNSRRSVRIIQPKPSNTISPKNTNPGYDLNSRKLRRYIIEDVMYIKPVHNILLLVCEDSSDFSYWEKIIKEQDSGLLTVVFGTKTYYQINASVINNVSHGAFVNGE